MSEPVYVFGRRREVVQNDSDCTLKIKELIASRATNRAYSVWNTSQQLVFDVWREWNEGRCVGTSLLMAWVEGHDFQGRRGWRRPGRNLLTHPLRIEPCGHNQYLRAFCTAGGLDRRSDRAINCAVSRVCFSMNFSGRWFDLE